jgi:nucleotide-binding universal stress UspA family protein
MFDRIVVGTDGSETATEAVRQAAELAKISSSELNIVSAFEPVSQNQLKEDADVPGDVANVVNPRQEVNVTLDNAAANAKKLKVKVQKHPREGDPADAILDVAEEIEADLIIVGNKGMTGAKRFLLGSVPNKVSHHSPCSVMIIQTT